MTEREIDLPDDELESLASISEEDIEHALQSWQQDAPQEAKELLNASPEDAPSSS